MKYHKEVSLNGLPTFLLKKVKLPSRLKEVQIGFFDGRINDESRINFDYISTFNGEEWVVSSNRGSLYDILEVFENANGGHPYVRKGYSLPPILKFPQDGKIVGNVLSEIVNFYNFLHEDENHFVVNPIISCSFFDVRSKYVNKLKGIIQKFIKEEKLKEDDVENYLTYTDSIKVYEYLKKYLKN